MDPVPYLRPIVSDGHATLRKAAKKMRPEELLDPLLQQLIDDMFETMYKAPGIGLAAPQINVSKRLFVVDLSVDREDYRLGPLVFVNPRFTAREGEVESTEGCLSVPGKVGDLKRYERVVCVALDRHGKRFEVEGKGLFGRCLQHEMDHLDGTLYIDKAQNIRAAVSEEEEETASVEGESTSTSDDGEDDAGKGESEAALSA
jgi:peptide deformylase